MSDLKRERGQGLVEFAVGITFLLVLLAGILDLGRAYFTYIALQDAAQEGASFGSIAPNNYADIRERVRSTSSGPIDFSLFDDSQIEIYPEEGFCTGDGIKVHVKINFQLVAPFFSGRSLPLSAEATDTILQGTCP